MPFSFRVVTGAALALALALAMPQVDAATIIRQGNYAAGDVPYFSDRIGLGPGRYRFRLDLSSPVDAVEGEIAKLVTFVDYCDREGDGSLVYCGADDTITAPLLERVSPTLYSAALTVSAPYSVVYPDGSRTDYSDDCCTYGFGFSASGPGRFTFSVSAVPEPESWAIALLGFGMVGIALRARRKRLSPGAAL